MEALWSHLPCGSLLVLQPSPASLRQCDTRIWCLHVHSAPCPGCLLQNVQNTSLLPQGTSPPKPPRAHDLKLLVRNIAVKPSDLRAAGNVAQVVLLHFRQGWGGVFFTFLSGEIMWKFWVTAYSQKKV